MVVVVVVVRAFLIGRLMPCVLDSLLDSSLARFQSLAGVWYE